MPSIALQAKLASARRMLALVLRIVLSLCLLAGAGRALAVTEIEPNNTCTTAQALGPLALNSTLTVNGALTSPPTTPDVDFFKFTATPGSMLRLRLSGILDGVDTLQSPLMGVFNSACGGLITAFASDPVQVTIPVPADGSVTVAVSSCCDFYFNGSGSYAGTYTLTMNDSLPIPSISGRVVDGSTLVPLPGRYVSLNECVDATCVSVQYVGQMFTDANGAYEFTANFSGQPLEAGLYQVTVLDTSGFYETATPAPVTAVGGQALVMPDVQMTLWPVLTSLTGRLVDAVTHAPLAGAVAPFAQVQLSSCVPYSCTFFSGSTDANGRFLFTRDAAGKGIPAGASISVFPSADQYQNSPGSFTAGAANTAQDLGDIPLVSNPVRFTMQQGCTNVPLTGGTCTYKVQITNGLATPQEGAAWATVNAFGLTGYVGNSMFQAGEAQDMTLAAATRVARSTRTASFSFPIPGNVPSYAILCPTFWFGVDPGNPQLNPQGMYTDVNSCVQRSSTGFVPTTPAQASALRKAAREHEAKERAAIGH